MQGQIRVRKARFRHNVGDFSNPALAVDVLRKIRIRNLLNIQVNRTRGFPCGCVLAQGGEKITCSSSENLF
jgi:hypothetical protein